LVVLNLVGTRYRSRGFVSFVANENIIVTLHANSIASLAGTLYKNMFESSETPIRTGTVVSTAVTAAGQTMTEP